MRRLIYISRSLMDASEIGSLVTVSTERNARVGITGMLWASNGCFAQVLEGDREQIAATMRRIARDPRHADIEVLLDREVTSRQFGNWSMRSAEDGEATAFMVGFALTQHTEPAERLREIVLASVL